MCGYYPSLLSWHMYANIPTGSSILLWVDWPGLVFVNNSQMMGSVANCEFTQSSDRLCRIGYLASFKLKANLFLIGYQMLKSIQSFVSKEKIVKVSKSWDGGLFEDDGEYFTLALIHTVAPWRELFCFLELRVPVELQEKLEKNISQKHLLFWLLSPHIPGHHFHVSMILAEEEFIPFNIFHNWE